MATDLLSLISAIRSRTDNLNTQAITDAEITFWCNEGVKEAWDIVCTANESFGVTGATFVLNSSSNVAPLPADFLKIRGLDRDPTASKPETVYPFNFAERNRQGRRTYRLIGNDLHIQPKKDAAGTYQLWYVQTPAELVSPSDTLDQTLSHLDDFVIVWASIKAKEKQEEDPRTLQGDLERQTERLITQAATRSSEPEQIPDVRGVCSPCHYDWSY